jgi:multidrug resistance efflux pump
VAEMMTIKERKEFLQARQIVDRIKNENAEIIFEYQNERSIRRKRTALLQQAKAQIEKLEAQLRKAKSQIEKLEARTDDLEAALAKSGIYM